ncbi:unnamed protein product [Arabidopsis halleri]
MRKLKSMEFIFRFLGMYTGCSRVKIMCLCLDLRVIVIHKQRRYVKRRRKKKKMRESETISLCGSRRSAEVVLGLKRLLSGGI